MPNTQDFDRDLHLAILAERASINGMSYSTARSYIESKERDLQISIIALRSVRNALAPIHALPDEILVHIFQLIAPEDPRQVSLRISLYWMYVTRVCSRWRNVAMGASTLWTFLDMRAGVRLVSEFIKRSKIAPLDFFMNSTAASVETVEQAMRVVKPHFGRVRRFEASLRLGAMTRLVEDLQQDAPILETISLAPASHNVIVPRDTAIIIPNIFNGHAPSLRQIHLSNTSIPWSLFQPPGGLVILDLNYQSPSEAPSMEIFLDILTNSPNLETLSLAHAGPQLSSNVFLCPTRTPTKIVDLPRLQALTLNNRAVDVAHLLVYLDVPTTCKLYLTADYTNWSGSHDPYTPLLSQGSSAARVLSSTLFLTISIDDMDNVSVVGHNTLDANPVRPSIDITSYDSPYISPLLNFTSFLQSSQVKELDIKNFATHGSETDWRHVFSNLNRLSTLCMTESNGVLVPVELVLRALQTTQVDRDSIVCPSLERLSLVGFDFGSSMDKELVGLCTRRATSGAPLATIHIPGLDQNLAKRLKEIITHVELCFT